MSSADETERQTLIRCYRLLTPAEAQNYYTVYESMRSITPKHFGISCANCRSEVSGARTMCLDCGVLTTVDLCEKPQCRQATIGANRRDDLVMPHLPSHRIARIHRVVHRHREFGKMYRAAQAALIRAEEALADAEDIPSPHLYGGCSRSPSLASDMVTGGLADRELSCVGCAQRVARPCWYCIECDDECFVCTRCESSTASFSCDHKPNHTLVRCAFSREDMLDTADREPSHLRIGHLETKLAQSQQENSSRFTALEDRLCALGIQSAKLDDRLQRIESLLASLASKF